VIQAIEAVGLQEVADRRFQTYSTGMRQRLAIARALLNAPRLLFMDEPTKGLDPTATRQLRQLIRQQLIEQQGITVFLTTHILDEAEQLCDRIAVMHRGQIRGCGTMAELRDVLGFVDHYSLLISSSLLVSSWLAASDNPPADTLPQPIITPLNACETLIEFEAPKDEATLDRALEAIHAAGGKIRAVTREQASLEDIFDRLVAAPAPASPAPSALPTEPTHPSAVASPSPSAAQRVRVALAFLKRDFREEASYRASFLLQFAGIVLSMALFYFIARLLKNAVSPLLAAYDGDYFAFVLIGLAFSGYFGVGLAGFSASLRQAQTTGTLEAMLATPTNLSVIILSSSLWSYLMTTLRVAVYLAAGALFAGVHLGNGNYPAALAILFLTIVAFSSLGIIAASFIMVLKRGDPITWAFSSLSTLLGGVYYPIAILPGWMQLLARLLPITYALEAMRRALLKGATFADLAGELLALAVFSAGLLPLSLLAFRLAVQRARSDGSLTHY
jgi:ABC-2 type transport system permease protein